mmetsp:Transcript_6575/g.13303  ORF Transcript_6575/g.13303 Transcript_6575/m.13303 type:complete len:1590 (+) Transcript_6575:983-5752(+)|eukprot:CAMPEP_0171499236 /NCGR_PEP_ID=MMETSP0958-20121227/8318_1 /TAXON_ID=87120 /ORGANISM="Aurantiochytrium limacinum, Strain ATCCMYA-1381" /LENGTH=1589 /DNA_ID=CAMNT_0012033773 /DNA_START=836 /DNA_END=5605 /DNA_ORIENTATION=+
MKRSSSDVNTPGDDAGGSAAKRPALEPGTIVNVAGIPISGRDAGASAAASLGGAGAKGSGADSSHGLAGASTSTVAGAGSRDATSNSGAAASHTGASSTISTTASQGSVASGISGLGGTSIAGGLGASAGSASDAAKGLKSASNVGAMGSAGSGISGLGGLGSNATGDSKSGADGKAGGASGRGVLGGAAGKADSGPGKNTGGGMGSGLAGGAGKARAGGAQGSADAKSKGNFSGGAGNNANSGTGAGQKRKQSKPVDNLKKEVNTTGGRNAGNKGDAGGVGKGGNKQQQHNSANTGRLMSSLGNIGIGQMPPNFPANVSPNLQKLMKGNSHGAGAMKMSSVPNPLRIGNPNMMGGAEAPGGMNMGQAPPSASAAAGQKQLGVEDALAYLDKVKQQFQDKPEVYNQFLEIMKNFKSQTIDTPGVIQHVCELFKGHDNLILGFNTFLPPGFKIEIPGRGAPGMAGGVMLPGGMQLGGAAAAGVPNLGSGPVMVSGPGATPVPATAAGAAAAAATAGGGSGTGNAAGNGRAKNARGGARAGGAGGRNAGNASGPTAAAAVAAPAAAPKVMPAHAIRPAATPAVDVKPPAGVPMVVDDNAGNAAAQGQPVEFDHAINYVTKIKKRFSEETDTYKSFLDILHSYQNEQRSIKEVLEQVSNLFKDHPDLLKEFTYFLPDAVRESAKSELVRRAAKAQKASQRAKEKNSRRKEKKGLPSTDSDQDEMRVPQLERNLLGRIKAALGTRELWGEFLKCLDLFAQELISRAELISLVSDILGERADLLEEFDRLLASRGATDDPVESAWFSMPLADIDFDNCRSCTPSYRGLPAAFPKAPCSERTALCRSVLNDTWVSVPFGSEDAGSKGFRRSPNEDALFRAEDDHYEVDLVIDSNLAAIRALEPLAQEIKSLGLQHGDSTKFRYRLEKRSLSVIHLKAIARIYGDHGTEILELLRRNPAGAIPVILRRLKEKHEEWCRDRLELSKQWREQMERNYLKSLDHRSFYFKQSEKRAHTQKVLLGELREAHNAKVKYDADPTKAASSIMASAQRPSGTVDMEFPDPVVHQHAWGIISLKVERICEKTVAQKIAAFYNYAFNPLFLLPLTWLSAGTPITETLNVNKYLSVTPAPRRREDALPEGTKVQTPFGPGTVGDYSVKSGFYTIALRFGVGYLRPGDVFKAVDPNEEEDKSPLVASFTKPVTMDDAAALDSATKGNTPSAEPRDVFTTTQAYCLLRLYHMLYSRLLRIKELCETRETLRRVKPMQTDDDDAMAVDKDGEDNEAKKTAEKVYNGEREYTQFLSLVYSLMNGTLDTPKFEDECRVLLGPESFVVFTIEKLVVAIQKQLSSIVSDDRPREAAELYASIEHPSESAKTHAERHPDPTVQVRGLAKAYSFVTSHLIIPADGFGIKAHFEPGERADPNKPVEDPKDVEGLPVKNTLVQLPPKKPKTWAKPPRISLSFSDLPMQLKPPTSDTIPAPVPLTIKYPSLEATNVVDVAARHDLSDVTKSFKSYVDAKDRSLAFCLPFFVVAHLPVPSGLPETTKKFAAAHPADTGASSAAPKVTGETWFAEVIAKTTAEMEADKQANAGGDTEMKTE